MVGSKERLKSVRQAGQTNATDSRGSSADTPRPSLTADAVIDAAAELTRESNLFSWSIRDLAKRLGANTSAIYYYVGGKDLLCRGVVERAGDGFAVPSADLPWQAWFRELLLEIGPRLMEFPGTAKWILMHGMASGSVLPAPNVGFQALHRAGFGEATNDAFALLINCATTTVAMGDDRLQHEEDGPRDHTTMMREFNRISSEYPAAASFSRDFIQPFADGGQTAQKARMSYYTFVVDTTIAGLESRLKSGEFAHAD